MAGMRNFRTTLLRLAPLLAVAMWPLFPSPAELESPAYQPPDPPTYRVRRTGVETLSPATQSEQRRLSGSRTPHLSEPGDQPPPTRLTRIQGEVVDRRGHPADALVFSTQCQGQTKTENGFFDLYFFAAGPIECDLQARTQHGLLNAISKTEWLTIHPEEQNWVQLSIDTEPQGGLGVAFELNGDGAEITWVHPGGPARREGLQIGDIIVEVSGENFVGVYDQNAFIQTTVGPIGSEVSLRLAGESQNRTLNRGHIAEDAEMGDVPPSAAGTGDDLDSDLPDSGWLSDGETGWLDSGFLATETQAF